MIANTTAWLVRAQGRAFEAAEFLPTNDPWIPARAGSATSPGRPRSLVQDLRRVWGGGRQGRRPH